MFPLPVAIEFLGHRGKDSDIEEIWNFVQNADWEAACELQKNTCVFVDWRQRAVDALEKNQGDLAAERFSEMLRKNPNASMADACAEILMRHKRYETASLIFRYALWDNQSCKAALEKELKLPQMGSLILIKDMNEQSLRINDISLKTTKPPQYPISDDARQRLTVLLGKDVGTNYLDWYRFVKDAIANYRGPISRDQYEEIVQVQDCLDRYSEGREYWHHLSDMILDRITSEVMLMAGKENEVKFLNEFFSKDKEDREIMIETMKSEVKSPEEIDLPFRHYMSFRSKQTENLPTVEKPNWDVPTTEELKGEIDRYLNDIEMIREKFLPDKDEGKDVKNPRIAEHHRFSIFLKL
jgi:tetratricopeptide (TPR) repeat protein